MLRVGGIRAAPPERAREAGSGLGREDDVRDVVVSLAGVVVGFVVVFLRSACVGAGLKGAKGEEGEDKGRRATEKRGREGSRDKER